MKKGVIVLVVLGLLVLSTGGFAALYFQEVTATRQARAQIAAVNTTISNLSKDMSSMRTLVPGVASNPGTSLAQLVAAVNPAVVRIDITGSGFKGVGSGFIVDQSGYVLTNQHVIENSSSIQITLTSGDSYAATVVDSDATRDLALIKLTSTRMDFPTISLGSATDAMVGDALLVVGYPLGLELPGPPSFTNGIVSAIRTIDGLEYIQTNAAINSGNSGGPVVDMQGQLVGMCVATVTDPNVNVEGLGLVIPVADILNFIDSGRISCSNCHYTTLD